MTDTPLTADENAEMRKVGFKPTKPENPDFRCRRCQSDDVWYRDIDSNPAFDDVEYRCLGCGRRWSGSVNAWRNPNSPLFSGMQGRGLHTSMPHWRDGND